MGNSKLPAKIYHPSGVLGVHDERRFYVHATATRLPFDTQLTSITPLGVTYK